MRIILFIMFAFLMGACSPRTVYVPQTREVWRTDTVYTAKVRVDSVAVHDSVAVMQRGDTVYITKTRNRTQIRELNDTIYQAVVDSMKSRVPYPVERKLSRWEQVKMDAGEFALSLLAAVAVMGLIALLIWLIKIRRRK